MIFLCQPQGYINPTHFPQNSFIYEISCQFTFCPDSINVLESSSKCVTVLVKKNNCAKICLDAMIQAIQATLVRNCFSRHSKRVISLSEIFDQINADIPFRRVNYPYLATSTCNIVFPISHFNMNVREWGSKMQSEIY